MAQVRWQDQLRFDQGKRQTTQHNSRNNTLYLTNRTRPQHHRHKGRGCCEYAENHRHRHLPGAIDSGSQQIFIGLSYAGTVLHGINALSDHHSIVNQYPEHQDKAKGRDTIDGHTQ